MAAQSPWLIDPLTGRRLEKETMSVRVLPRATPKAIERARKAWPQADAGDFDSPPQELDCLGLDPLRFRRRINLDLEALLGGPAVSDVSSRRCFRRRKWSRSSASSRRLVAPSVRTSEVRRRAPICGNIP